MPVDLVYGEAQVEATAVRFSCGVPAERLRETQIVEDRWAEVDGQIADLLDRLVDESERLVPGVGGPPILLLHIELDRAQHRAEVVMQFASDGAALRLLRVEESAGKGLQPRALVAQLACRVFLLDGGGEHVGDRPDEVDLVGHEGTGARRVRGKHAEGPLAPEN